MTTPMTPLELHLLATPKAAPELRHHLRGHGFDVRLCATELLTNVIDHLGEGTPVTVRVGGTAAGNRTRIEVTDPDPRALPVLMSATEVAESGRGVGSRGRARRAVGRGTGAGPEDGVVRVEELRRGLRGTDVGGG